jgi:hypothetical protein
VTTVFVDRFSGLLYVHNQLSTGAKHTIKAKRAFERYAKAHGISIMHYHANNWIYASKDFMNEVIRCQQSITFCVVNAHHQNGRAEKKICDLQESARTMILHAKQRWPDAISANLWPFAIRMANKAINSAPIRDQEASPILELFSKVPIAPRIKHMHTFGSPVYILDTRLQANQSTAKWSNRARVCWLM